MAVSTHLVGFCGFFTELFMDLGVDVDRRTKYVFHKINEERKYHVEYSRTEKYRVKKREEVFRKIKEFFSKERSGPSIEAGYGPGIGFELPEETIVRCKRCGGIGHKTANSKMCLFHRSRIVPQTLPENESTVPGDSNLAGNEVPNSYSTTNSVNIHNQYSTETVMQPITRDDEQTSGMYHSTKVCIRKNPQENGDISDDDSSEQISELRVDDDIAAIDSIESINASFPVESEVSNLLHDLMNLD